MKNHAHLLLLQTNLNMKKTFTLLVICFSQTNCAQDCKTLYYLQNNKSVEMTIYNKKGNANGKHVYSISDVNKAGLTATSIVNQEMFDKDGKLVARTSNKIQCEGGAVMIDMKMFIPSQQMEQIHNTELTATSSYLEYPASINIGDKLKNGKVNINVTNNGLAMSLDLYMTNRLVKAIEKVSSIAGTWDAFKIIYNSKIKMKIAGIGIPINMEVSEWYVPDFGIVKTESGNGSTLITAIK